MTADEAYDARKCYGAIVARNAHAIIPPRKNSKPWNPTSACAIARNEAVTASRYPGRAIWQRWSGYHHLQNGTADAFEWRCYSPSAIGGSKSAPFLSGSTGTLGGVRRAQPIYVAT